MAQGWLKVKLMASSGSSRFFLLCRGEVGLHVRGRDAEGFEVGYSVRSTAPGILGVGNASTYMYLPEAAYARQRSQWHCAWRIVVTGPCREASGRGSQAVERKHRTGLH